MNKAEPIKTKIELLSRLAGLGKVNEDQRKRVSCTLIGHSKIITQCFGYIHCARCDDQIGDTLGSVFDGSKHVIVDHDCKTCRNNWKKLTWKDKFLVDYKMIKPVSNKEEA